MSSFYLSESCSETCFRWDKPPGYRASHARRCALGQGLTLRRFPGSIQQFAQSGGLVVGRNESVSLANHQRPPRAILWSDLVTLGRDQQTALKAPASPGSTRKLQARQDAAKFIDRKRDSVRAGFPVMPSALGHLKILRSGTSRPA